MADDLSKRCAQLSIIEEEEEIVEFDEATNKTIADKVTLSLVGKVLSVRNYNFNALKNTMNQVWSLSKKLYSEKLKITCS